MCGRYVIASPPEVMRHFFRYAGQPNFPARYNVAPTQPVPVVVEDTGGARSFELMRWGLLPAWLKDPRGFPLMINARSETILEKAAFRNAIRRRRCLLPADGYYEWQVSGSHKQAYFIYPRESGPFGFAGIAETWAGPNGEEVDTVAIVTVQSSPDLAVLHQRAPIVIAPDDFDRWLDCRSGDAREILPLLQPPAQHAFAWHPVSAAVNRVSNDDPRLIEPLTEEALAREVEASAPKQTRVQRVSHPPVAKVDQGQGSLF